MSEFEDSIIRMETIAERDKKLEEIWKIFADVPFNPETECIEESFLDFTAGTHREEIWHWFDERHSKGVAFLLYRTGMNQPPKIMQLLQKESMCEECMSETCAFNPEGICRFPLVYGRKPRLSEEGCSDWLFADY